MNGPTNIEEILRQELTDEQRAAATDESADILVIACAGSGKSRTLAYRIAWLIARGADPASIVAFTFTEKAADSIQQRVATALMKTGRSATEVGRVRIGTIHGFCRETLVRIDARYRQFDVLDQNGLHLFLMSRYPELGIRDLRDRAGRYFATITALADAWANLHDEMLDLEDVTLHDQDLGEALSRLRDLLDDSNYIDFSSMIRLIVDRLQAGDPATLEAVGGIRHLLVDEYQDTNPLQERLIRLLRSGCETLAVVGDDDQSIYGWRGANVQNILEFGHRNPGASRHTLAHNFRSTPLIVRSADAFVRAEIGANRLTKAPTAGMGEGPHELGVFGFGDRRAEAEWVSARIAALLGSTYIDGDVPRGLTCADFAILMRSTGSKEQDGIARSKAFTDALEARGIEYTLEAGGSVFGRPQVAVLREAMALLRNESPDRDTVLRFVHERVQPVFPGVRPTAATELYADWGRRIHTPVDVERRRVFPQQLLHDLLAACDFSRSDLDDGVAADIGVLSRLLQDVETVYVSIDTAQRFGGILNFMQNIAESGYQTATDGAVRRPDAVTVSTVHKAKGLEYPVVFIVDMEGRRFPGRDSEYDGWLPRDVIGDAIQSPRLAYGNNREQEARLFYTAMTRAERYLYVTHSMLLPGGKTRRKESPFSARLDDAEVVRDAPQPNELPPNDLPAAAPRRRVDETVLPTTFSEIRYYLCCPRDYKFRYVWGFSPPIPEMFGFGQTVHAAVGKLHEQYPQRPPTAEEAEEVARGVFHLKHVPPSRDPVERPGAYERAAEASAGIVRRYAEDFGDDFVRRRQLEVRFEIPLRDSVLSGSIDLLLRLDDQGGILDANVIDFKSMEGGPDPENNPELDWSELALQVQLYARAAADVLDANARTGHVHLLKDGHRVEVPVDAVAVQAAVENVEWAAERIIAGDFPMRPHTDKCGDCDWKRLCPQARQEFASQDRPPPLHLPGDRRIEARAIGQVAE